MFIPRFPRPEHALSLRVLRDEPTTWQLDRSLTRPVDAPRRPSLWRRIFG
ncbi:hypothetical protein [Streptosporangium sp. NPDC051022]